MKTVKRRHSKVARALAYLAANPGATPYAAAKAVGMPSPALYTKLKTMAAQADGVCACCGQSLPKPQAHVSVEVITLQKK